MVKSEYVNIETPALLIDYERLIDNMDFMQAKADKFNVRLRPHTKTHKMPLLAKMTVERGCKGITVAKVGEAEVMAEHGLEDIFIANQIVGKNKIERIKELSKTIDISVGVDCPGHVADLNESFEGQDKKIPILIEIEVGEKRSGIILEEDMNNLLDFIKTQANVELIGVFSHEGHTYMAESKEKCLEEFLVSQRRTLYFADLAGKKGFNIRVVSVGATPSLMHCSDILEGITEIRPGTYVLMDASQGNAVGSYERCAASVLATVISLPTDERIITDSGAKALTAQTRNTGICKTEGLGYVKNSSAVYLYKVFDEHGIIYSRELNSELSIGDRIEIIPNHICPVCNLYDQAYLVSGGKVKDTVDISCRGKLT